MKDAPTATQATSGETDTKRKSYFPETKDSGQPPHKMNHSQASPSGDQGTVGDSPNGTKRPGRKLLTTEAASKRTAQNRAAQRAFRERKQRYVETLEAKVKELEAKEKTTSEENARLRELIEQLRSENSSLKGTQFNVDLPANARELQLEFQKMLGLLATDTSTASGQNLPASVAPSAPDNQNGQTLGLDPSMSTLLVSLLGNSTTTNTEAYPTLASNAYSQVPGTIAPMGDINDFTLNNTLFTDYREPGQGTEGPFFDETAVGAWDPASASALDASWAHTTAAASTSATSPAKTATADIQPIPGITSPISPSADLDAATTTLDYSTAFAALPFADLYDFNNVTLINAQPYDTLATSSSSAYPTLTATPQSVDSSLATPTSTDPAAASYTAHLNQGSQMFGPAVAGPKSQFGTISGLFDNQGTAYVSPPATGDAHSSDNTMLQWLTTPSPGSSASQPSATPTTDRRPSSGLSPFTPYRCSMASLDAAHPRGPLVMLGKSDNICKSGSRMKDCELDELCRELEIHAKCSEYRKLKQLMEDSPSSTQGIKL
ncbi:DNA-binding transcription factor yap1 [Dimargaris xerosporica]|nr:DNA-binding transcription factor yap1 [Dimargaris xerosporica]